MQVADITELASSATLGAGKAQRMSMAEDPALYLTMIISLYPNVKLAFIRETICNQWDAHIASGRTSTPIKITIDEDYVLTFRDYGYGIPIAKMDSTYNTLGGSTKRASTAETGGFGLGCKSPIAYAESFKVTTMNNGTKGIYNMVRSSVETDGFPGLVPIVQLPTDETGLEVSIQLQKHDLAEIIGYIRSVVYNGSMLCEFDCKISGYDSKALLPMLDMSFEPGSYSVDSNQWYQRHMGNHAVFIRYGNVVYPALDTPATERAFNLIHDFLGVIGYPRILVQAKPSSLAVAPSRETLSSQKMTEDGITDLVVGLVDKLEADIKAAIPDAIEEIRETIKSTACSNFSKREYLDYLSSVSNKMVRGYMRSSLWAKQRNHYIKEFRNLELDTQINDPNLPDNNKLRAKYRAVLKTAKSDKRTLRSSTVLPEFYYKYALIPLLKELGKLGYNKSAKLFAKTNYMHIWDISYLRQCSYIDTDIFKLLRNKTVFITSRMRGVEGSIVDYPEFAAIRKNWDINESEMNSVVIKVGTKKDESKPVVAAFANAGWKVIDLTENHEWDRVVTARKAAAKVKKAKADAAKARSPEVAAKIEATKKNRLVCVRALVNNKQFSTSNANPHHGKRHVDIANPKYYCMIDNVSVWKKTLSNITSYHMLPDDIVDVTIICRNGIERNKAIKLGAVHIDEWTKPYLLSIIKDKAFVKYATKERQTILPSLNIYSYELKLLAYLGITVPGLNKLRYDRKFEQLIKLADECNLSHTIREWEKEEAITSKEKDFIYDAASGKAFTNRDVLRKYLKICKEGIAGLGYVNPKDALAYLKQYPELVPAYRALFKHTLKLRLNK